MPSFQIFTKKSVMCKLLCGILKLKVELVRSTYIEHEELICKLCKKENLVYSRTNLYKIFHDHFYMLTNCIYGIVIL